MAHPLDVLVGTRLRKRRLQLGMTAQQLADSVGVTCQKIEEYETGADRISACRIWDLAAVVEVPVLFFFEGLDGQPSNVDDTRDGLFTIKETLDLMRA